MTETNNYNQIESPAPNHALGQAASSSAICRKKITRFHKG